MAPTKLRIARLNRSGIADLEAFGVHAGTSHRRNWWRARRISLRRVWRVACHHRKLGGVHPGWLAAPRRQRSNRDCRRASARKRPTTSSAGSEKPDDGRRSPRRSCRMDRRATFSPSNDLPSARRGYAFVAPSSSSATALQVPPDLMAMLGVRLVSMASGRRAASRYRRVCRAPEPVPGYVRCRPGAGRARLRRMALSSPSRRSSATGAGMVARSDLTDDVTPARLADLLGQGERSRWPRRRRVLSSGMASDAIDVYLADI